jgi:hypothetical protein
MSKFVIALSAIVLSVSPAARAGFILNVVQSGPNVVGTGSGTLDTTALSNLGSAGDQAEIFPSFFAVSAGPATDVSVIDWGGISGPSTIGSGPAVFANSGSGDLVSIFTGGIYTPTGYVSGSALSDTATWDGTTIASLGLTPGSSTWTWGSGPTADSFVLNIGPVAVPEPSSTVLFALGAAALIFVRVRRCA